MPQGVYDSWLANGTGWYSPAGYPFLPYVDDCENNPWGAISVSLSASFRYPDSYWNIQIFSGGIKVFDLDDPDSGIYNYQNWIRGGGANYLSSPEQINPETGRASLVVDFSPPSTINKTFTYSKLYKTNGVRVTNIRGGTNNRATLFKIEEINPTTNQIVKTRTIENSVVASVKSYSLSCDGGCPSYTCEVDCGDKICCYGSDGIARNFYYK